jgi:hypothetical protein
MAGGIRKAMVFAMLTIGFHMLVFFLHQPKGTFGKLFGLVPSVLVVAALLLKPVTSIMNFYYTQWHFVTRVSTLPWVADNLLPECTSTLWSQLANRF